MRYILSGNGALALQILKHLCFVVALLLVKALRNEGERGWIRSSVMFIEIFDSLFRNVTTELHPTFAFTLQNADRLCLYINPMTSLPCIAVCRSAFHRS